MIILLTKLNFKKKINYDFKILFIVIIITITIIIIIIEYFAIPNLTKKKIFLSINH